MPQGHHTGAPAQAEALVLRSVFWDRQSIVRERRGVLGDEPEEVNENMATSPARTSDDAPCTKLELSRGQRWIECSGG
ncbi:hypothetical protein IMZ48_28570 [Candidatus Bathyarchaeota archaeon]|nr:hypothetical protein [Candidatus Bathyarchaeota archaeon]